MDYSVYRLSKKELIQAVIGAGVVLFIIGFIFYKNPVIAVIFSAGGLYYPRIIQKKRLLRRKSELSMQFQQALYILSSLLAAGRSVEGAFAAAAKDMKHLYADHDLDMIRELDWINTKVNNGETIERAVADFSRRASIEDISNFSEVLMTCKRTGGNLVEVVHKTSNMISEKLAIHQEIEIMLAQKKFESRLLSFAPIVFVAVLSWGSPDYMKPLYEGTGLMVMTAGLLLLALCCWINQWITNIKV